MPIPLKRSNAFPSRFIFLEELHHRPGPHLTVAEHRLIDDHLLQHLTILRNPYESVHPAPEMSVILVHKANKATLALSIKRRNTGGKRCRDISTLSD